MYRVFLEGGRVPFGLAPPWKYPPDVAVYLLGIRILPGFLLGNSRLYPDINWGISWGTLAQDGWRAMRTYPHVISFPGFAIFLTILAFNFLGNTLRDILDLKGRLR